MRCNIVLKTSFDVNYLFLYDSSCRPLSETSHQHLHIACSLTTEQIDRRHHLKAFFFAFDSGCFHINKICSNEKKRLSPLKSTPIHHIIATLFRDCSNGYMWKGANFSERHWYHVVPCYVFLLQRVQHMKIFIRLRKALLDYGLIGHEHYSKHSLRPNST